MQQYLRGFAFLALAAVCGVAALLLPDGLPRGMAGIATFGLALVAVCNLVVALRQDT